MLVFRDSRFSTIIMLDGVILQKLFGLSAINALELLLTQTTVHWYAKKDPNNTTSKITLIRTIIIGGLAVVALAIATWAAWFWAAQGRLLTKKKEERKGQKGRFNIFATAGLRTQSAPDHYHAFLDWPESNTACLKGGGCWQTLKKTQWLNIPRFPKKLTYLKARSRPIR